MNFVRRDLRGVIEMAGYREGIEDVTLSSQNESYGSAGIALYSANDTVNNYSDTEGTYYNQIRIRWTATDNGDGTFAEGSGLTGTGWYLDATQYAGSPLAGYSEDQIYNSIFGESGSGNLNSEFATWANNGISDEIKNEFIFGTLWATGCVDVTWGGGSE